MMPQPSPNVSYFAMRYQAAKGQVWCQNFHPEQHKLNELTKHDNGGVESCLPAATIITMVLWYPLTQKCTTQKLVCVLLDSPQSLFPQVVLSRTESLPALRVTASKKQNHYSLLEVHLNVQDCPLVQSPSWCFCLKGTVALSSPGPWLGSLKPTLMNFH